MEVPDNNFPLKHPKYYIYLETSGKIQLNEDDPNHRDIHHEPQDDGGYPPKYEQVPDNHLSKIAKLTKLTKLTRVAKIAKVAKVAKVAQVAKVAKIVKVDIHYE